MTNVVPINQQEQPKQLPVNQELEQALLGAILYNNEAFDRVSSFLEPSDFYEPLHQDIFKVVSDLISVNKIANPVTIKTFIPWEEPIGNTTVGKYIAEIVSEAPTVVNAYDYGVGLRELAVRRQALNLVEEFEASIRLPDAITPTYDLIKGFEDQLAEIQNRTLKGNSPTGYEQTANDYLDGLAKAYQQQEVEGVPFPLKEFEHILSEPKMEAGNLYGLLAGSSEGKTSLILQFIWKAIVAGNPLIFLSFDQSSVQCHRQLAAQVLAIDAQKQKRGEITEAEFSKISEFIGEHRNAPCEFIKVRDIQAHQIGGIVRPRMKRFKAQTDLVPLVIVDHIARFEPHDNKAHEGRIAGHINARCKDLAGEFECAWLNINQRNSRGLSRENAHPTPQDLFGGIGALQDYDAMLYLFREEYYLRNRLNIETVESRKDKLIQRIEEIKEQAKIGALKVRFGDPTRYRQLRFDPKYTKYYSMEQNRQYDDGRELF